MVDNTMEVKMDEQKLKERLAQRKKLIELYKKNAGVDNIGIGYFKEVCFAFGIPSEGWEEISSGIVQGNFDHLEFNGFHYYSYVIDPLEDINIVMIFKTKEKKDHTQLVKMVNLWNDLQRVDPTQVKRCWECGKEFTFWDIRWKKDLPPLDALQRVVDDWFDNYDRCSD